MSGTRSKGDGFREAGRFLAELDPESAARAIAASADVALVLERGVIRDVALGNEELAREGYDRSWLGKPWIETVTIESRPKITELMETEPDGTPLWRQVNHPSSTGVDVPVRYATVPTGSSDRIVALGRDLRSVSRLQQRLVEAHQGLERDYARLREAEARYNLLFQSVSQPVLIVDPVSLSLEEANPAAARALGRPAHMLLGHSLGEFFPEKAQRRVAKLVAEALSSGTSHALGVGLREGPPCDLTASAFRQGNATRVIVHLRLDPSGGEEVVTASHGDLLGVLEELPDGLVVVGPELRILAANRAFVEMAQLISPGQMVGGRLSDYLGRSATDLNVLVSNLKNYGVVRGFSTVLRDRFGQEEEVEVSAVVAPLEDSEAYGFSVRSVARRLRSTPRIGEELPSSPDQLTELVGRVPLKQIVRESTDFIEKLCIEAALEITDDNRASAAEILGLSRQGLYSKLKRFGFDEQE